MHDIKQHCSMISVAVVLCVVKQVLCGRLVDVC